MTAEGERLEANEADVLEQSIPAQEHGIIQTGGHRDQASEADLIEGSIEVLVDDEEEEPR